MCVPQSELYNSIWNMIKWPMQKLLRLETPHTLGLHIIYELVSVKWPKGCLQREKKSIFRDIRPKWYCWNPKFSLVLNWGHTGYSKLILPRLIYYRTTKTISSTKFVVNNGIGPCTDWAMSLLVISRVIANSIALQNPSGKGLMNFLATILTDKCDRKWIKIW